MFYWLVGFVYKFFYQCLPFDSFDMRSLLFHELKNAGKYRSRALKSRFELRVAICYRARCTWNFYLLYENSSLLSKTFLEKVLSFAKSRDSQVRGYGIWSWDYYTIFDLIYVTKLKQKSRCPTLQACHYETNQVNTSFFAICALNENNVT